MLLKSLVWRATRSHLYHSLRFCFIFSFSIPRLLFYFSKHIECETEWYSFQTESVILIIWIAYLYLVFESWIVKFALNFNFLNKSSESWGHNETRSLIKLNGLQLHVKQVTIMTIFCLNPKLINLRMLLLKFFQEIICPDQSVRLNLVKFLEFN